MLDNFFMEAVCQELLNKVIGSYRKSGIELSYKPKIVLAAQASRPFSLFIEHIPPLHERGKPEDFETHYRQVAEAIGIPYEKIFRENHEIDIFSPKEQRTLYISESFVERCLFGEDMGHLERALAHDFWHLVEDERDIIHKEFCILEGTAQYASYRGRLAFLERKYTFRSFKDVENEDLNFDLYYYSVCARVVMETVEQRNPENPLPLLLEETVRKKIRIRFEKELFSFLERKRATSPIPVDIPSL